MIDEELRDLNSRVQSTLEKENVASYAHYYRIAAVLAYFYPQDLQVSFPEEITQDQLSILLADSNEHYDNQGRSRRILRRELRKKILRYLADQNELKMTVDSIPHRPKDTVQQMLEAYINGIAPPIEEQNREQLFATCEVSDWLNGIVIGLPDSERLQERIERENLLEPFRSHIKQGFSGRRVELAELSSYLGIGQQKLGPTPSGDAVRENRSLSNEPPLVFYGPGGIGKSTLLARCILDIAEKNNSDRFPFVYIDFDRPGIRIEEPLSILIQTSRQLKAQYPEKKDVWKEFEEKLTRNNSNQDLTSPLPTEEENSLDKKIAKEIRLSYALKNLVKLIDETVDTSNKPFLLVFDSFEDVQYFSREFVHGLRSFLDDWQKEMPHLRILIAGRNPIPELRTLEYRHRERELRNFDQEASQAFLQARGIQKELAVVVAAQVGGNPLCLRLAVEVIKREGADSKGIKNFEKHIEDGLIQGFLYNRILDLIHDDSVRKLAHPGLVLRRFTPEIIGQVLAEPCDLGVLDAKDAEGLFRELERELSLVQMEEDGALSHRPDVRELTLRLLQKDKSEKVEQIHRKAISFYEQKESLTAREEELYHRLSLGENFDTLDKRWTDQVGQRLVRVIHEFPPKSQAYLAASYGGELPENIVSQLELPEWERYALKQAERFLNSDNLDSALSVLDGRQERTEDSPLYLIKAQVLERQKQFLEALDLAEKGSKSAARVGNQETSHQLSRFVKQAEMNAENSELEVNLYRLRDAAKHAEERIRHVIEEDKQLKSICYQVKSRVKEVHRTMEKIFLKRLEGKEKYGPETITDICAFRLVTYYQSDVVKALEHLHRLINHEGHWPSPFIKDSLQELRVYDSRPEIDPLSIAALINTTLGSKLGIHVTPLHSPRGYSSIHLLAECDTSALKAPLPGKVWVEIQIRSAFEDVWGEIDHQLRYGTLRGERSVTSWDQHLNVLKNLVDSCVQYIEVIKSQADKEPLNVPPEGITKISISSPGDRLLNSREVPDDIRQSLNDALTRMQWAKDAGSEEAAGKLFQEAAKLFSSSLYVKSLPFIEKERGTAVAHDLNYTIWMECAYCLMNTGSEEDLKEAARIYEKIEKEEQDDSSSRFRHGQILHRQEKYNEAIPFYDQAIEILLSARDRYVSKDEWLLPEAQRCRGLSFWRLSLDQPSTAEGSKERWRILSLAMESVQHAFDNTNEGSDVYMRALNDLVYYGYEEREMRPSGEKFVLSEKKFKDLACKLADFVNLPQETSYERLDTVCRALILINDDRAHVAAERVIDVLKDRIIVRAGYSLVRSEEERRKWIVNNKDMSYLTGDECDAFIFASQILYRDRGK